MKLSQSPIFQKYFLYNSSGSKVQKNDLKVQYSALDNPLK
jgi:hypothetical protein